MKEEQTLFLSHIMPYIVRPKISHPTFMSLNFTGPQRPNHIMSLLSSDLLPIQREILPPGQFLYQPDQLLTSQSVLNLTAFISLPDLLFKQQSPPAAGNRGSSHCFVTTKLAFYRPCLFNLFSSTPPISVLDRMLVAAVALLQHASCHTLGIDGGFHRQLQQKPGK